MSAPARLFDLDGLWEVVKRTDVIVNALADQHYNRRASSIGCGKVCGPGESIVLRAVDHQAAWITYYTEKPDDGLDAWRCTLFRNEGQMLSSSLIKAAVALTAELWGTPRPDGWLTYVDAAKVETEVPGWCFRRAGWKRDRTYQPDRRRRTLIRLRKAITA